MIRIFSKIVFPLFFMCLIIVGCAGENSVDDVYVLQIKDVGLREGVFVRRYQLAGEYGSAETFTSDMLKNYISRILEPNYLFIQHAYDLGLNKEWTIALIIKDYKINLLANNHPIKFAELTILKDDLRDFYARRKIRYNIDLVQAKTFTRADSLCRLLRDGGNIDRAREEFNQPFPRQSHFDALLYGEHLHPELFSLLEKLNEGEASNPVYAGTTWNVVRMNKKSPNQSLPLFKECEQDLLSQAQTFFKYRQQKELVANLSKKYNVSVNDAQLASMVKAYNASVHNRRIEENMIANSELKEIFINFDNNDVPLSLFISSFNQSSPFMQLPRLSENDLQQFVADYIAQNLLYLDALEQGVDQDVLIQDKLVNKEHRTLLAEYLKKELAQKISVTEKEARQHYENNRDKWQGDFPDVAGNVKGDLKGKKLEERKNKIAEKLRKKYAVRYNEQLLQNIANQLSSLKKSAVIE